MAILVIHGAARLSTIIEGFVSEHYHSIYRYVDSSCFNDNGISAESIKSMNIISNPIFLEGASTFDYVSTIGYKNMLARQKAFEWAQSHYSLNPINVVHPKSYISPDARIGVGNIFLPGVIVEPGVTLGNNNIFWSNSTVCHDCIIGSHNFIAASAVLGGYVQLGDSCFLGFGSIINDHLKVADDTFLASGSVLIKNHSVSGERLCGVPAKIMPTPFPPEN